jgi:hypothetical protein
MDDTQKGCVVVFIIGLMILFLIFGPIFTIWALNTVFGTEIPTTFKTWVAVVWLLTVLHGFKINVKSNN